MRRSVLATWLILASAIVIVFTSALPHGYAQTTPPQGDEFDASGFTAPFVPKCGQFANPQPCPDAQAANTWNLNSQSPGNLRIWTRFGSLVGTASQASNNARNFIVQPVGSGADYTVTTKLTFPANTGTVGALGQTAGLIVYQDDDNFIMFGREFTTQNGVAISRLDFIQEVNGVDNPPFYYVEPTTPQTVYLRLTKVGTFYQASYSYDNVNFVTLGPLVATATPTNTPTSTLTPTSTATPTPTPTNTATPTNTPTATPTATTTGAPTAYSASYSSPQVGVFAWGGTNASVESNLLAADFDWFRVGNSQTPAATATPTVTGTATSTSTPASTATNTPTLTPTVTPTATLTPTVTLTPTPTNTPIPTPTPRPATPALRFLYISLWYHVVRVGTFNHVEVQGVPRTRLGIWAHVIFPNAPPKAYYENTDSRGHWSKTFGIPRNAISTRSRQATVTLQLWRGRRTRKNFVLFTLVR